MKIAVCVKHVPDTETRIRIAEDGKSIIKEGVTFVVNPYDEYAVEEALLLKEKAGDGEVTVLTIGPEDAGESLRKCLAMGADKAVHIKGEGLEEADSLGIARGLTDALRDMEYDLILMGWQGIGMDNSQVGPMVAANLDIPHVGVVTSLEIGDGRAEAIREIEGAREKVECPLPAVITAQKGLNEPRYPSLKGIMMAKKKEIVEKDVSEPGLTEAGEAAKVKVVKMELPPEKTAGRVIEGEPEDAARELVKILHEEEKIL